MYRGYWLGNYLGRKYSPQKLYYFYLFIVNCFHGSFFIFCRTCAYHWKSFHINKMFFIIILAYSINWSLFIVLFFGIFITLLISFVCCLSFCARYHLLLSEVWHPIIKSIFHVVKYCFLVILYNLFTCHCRCIGSWFMIMLFPFYIYIYTFNRTSVTFSSC